MAIEDIEARVIQKIATEAEWAASTILPRKGEFMIVGDSNSTPINIKVGNGVDMYPALPYMFDSIQQNVNYYPVSTLALPTPAANNVFSLVTEGPYSYNGSPVFSVGQGNIGIVYWDGSAWSLLSEMALPVVPTDENFDQTSSNAQSGIAINSFLFEDGLSEITGGVRNYNNIIAPTGTQHTKFLVDDPVARSGQIRTITCSIPTSGIFVLKIFRPTGGGNLSFISQAGYSVASPGVVTINCETDNATTGSPIVMDVLEGDIPAVYFLNGVNNTNSDPVVNSYYYSESNVNADINTSSLVLVSGEAPVISFIVGFSRLSVISDDINNISGEQVPTYNVVSNLFNKTAITEGSVFERDESSTFQYFDTDNSNIQYDTPLGYVSAQGGSRYVRNAGNILDWDFTLDGTNKVNFAPTLENIVPNESYQFVIGNVTWSRLQFPNYMNSLQFKEQVIDFVFDSNNTNDSFIASAFDGVTIFSRKLGHVVSFYPIQKTLRLLETESMGSTAFTSLSTVDIAPSVSVGDTFRIIQRFNGATITGLLYKLVGSSFSLIGEVSHTYGLGRNRPSNLIPSIFVKNIGATINNFKLNSYERDNIKLLFIGDSNQSGFGTTDFENAYPRMAQRYVGNAVSVRSSSGGTTDDFLAMLPEIIDREPRVVVMALGLNDVRYGVADYQTKYQSIVNQLENVGSKVIICRLLPNNITDVTAFNAWLDDTYSDNHVMVDFYTDFTDGGTGLNPLYDSGDGTHPNDLGTALMFQKLKVYL